MSSALWWTARGARPAPTSQGTTIALVGGVSSATIDTGVTEGTVALMQLWVGAASVDHAHIIFGQTSPVQDPALDGYSVIETDGVAASQPVLFLITAKSQFFRVFSSASRDIQYQVEEIQGE